MALAVFTIQIKAETVETTVQFSARGAEIIGGRVTVFDAGSGRQIANGVTVRDNRGEYKFVFTSTGGQNVVIVVMSSNGCIGAGRGTTDGLIYVFAGQLVTEMPFVRADANGNATLTFTNASGNPVRNAIVSVAEWASFGNARRGRTNTQGQYHFNDPGDLEGSDFLAVEWKGAGAISLTAVLTGDHMIPGEVDSEQ